MQDDHPTIFAEANFLLYVVDGDEDAARKIVAGFTPQHLAELHSALLKATMLCGHIFSERLIEANEAVEKLDDYYEED